MSCRGKRHRRSRAVNRGTTNLTRTARATQVMLLSSCMVPVAPMASMMRLWFVVFTRRVTVLHVSFYWGAFAEDRAQSAMYLDILLSNCEKRYQAPAGRSGEDGAGEPRWLCLAGSSKSGKFDRRMSFLRGISRSNYPPACRLAFRPPVSGPPTAGHA